MAHSVIKACVLGPVVAFLLSHLFPSAFGQMVISNQLDKGQLVGDALRVEISTNAADQTAVAEAQEVFTQIQLDAASISAGGNALEVNKTAMTLWSDGSRTVKTLSRYTQLGSGMRYQDEAGQWQTA